MIRIPPQPTKLHSLSPSFQLPLAPVVIMHHTPFLPIDPSEPNTRNDMYTTIQIDDMSGEKTVK